MLKYKPEFAEQLPQMFKNGEAVEEVIVKLGIRRSTFYEWAKKYPEFADAYEHGKELSQAWWLKVGRAGAIGQGEIQLQPTVWIFNMKNRLGWKDKSETDITTKGKSISNNFTIQPVTPKKDG